MEYERLINHYQKYFKEYKNLIKNICLEFKHNNHIETQEPLYTLKQIKKDNREHIKTLINLYIYFSHNYLMEYIKFPNEIKPNYILMETTQEKYNTIHKELKEIERAIIKKS